MYIYVHVVVRPNPENNKIVFFFVYFVYFSKNFAKSMAGCITISNCKGVQKGALRHKYPTIGPHDLGITPIIKLKEINWIKT